jgi:AbrB family looped-hinge helix DNA binding protein
MQALATTRMSSKGQIVIPENIRDRLGLEAGAQFVVIGEDDVVILKTLQQPAMSEFDNLIRKARQQARTSGMKRSDVAKARTRVRSRK